VINQHLAVLHSSASCFCDLPRRRVRANLSGKGGGSGLIRVTSYTVYCVFVLRAQSTWNFNAACRTVLFRDSAFF